MNRRLLALALVLLPLAIQAQNPPAAPPKPQLYVVHEEIAKPSMLAQYEATTQEFFKMLSQAKVDPAAFSIRGYVSPDFHYFYVAPIEGFAGMDKIVNVFMAIPGAVGKEHWEEFMRRSGATMQSVNDRIVMLRPELSYMPANPRLKMDEHKYYRWQFYYLMPGTELEAEQIARDYAALFKKKNIAERFAIFTALSGDDLPLLVASIPAKSEADLVTADERTNAALGDEVKPLQARAMSVTRKLEIREARVRPDLVYPPPPPAK